MAKTKFETLIEHIVNDETDAARSLLHDIVVEKSREIYNEMMDDDDDDGMLGVSDETDDLEDDIEADELGMDHDMDDMDHDMSDMESDMDMDHDMDDDSDMEDRIVDLESALDDLKAEFDKLMSAEEEEHHDLGIEHDDEEMEMDSDSDMEDMDSDFDLSDEEEDEEEGEEGSAPKTSSELMREYVEKLRDVYAPSSSQEGAPVGSTGGKIKPNTKSIVAKENDMGGTVVKTGKGPTSNQDGKSPSKASNEYTKGEGKVPHADKFMNVPGGKAGNTYGSAKKPVSSEEGKTNKTSPVAK